MSDPTAPSGSPFAIHPTDHMLFARAIARGVGSDFGFRRGGQEERELESAAYVVVCEYAVRFDPLVSYRRGAERAIVAACRAWRVGAPIPATSGPVRFAGLDQTVWAGALGARIAGKRKFKKGDPRRQALVHVALFVAARKVVEFQPHLAFRGWAAVAVRGECKREAIRLRNGGTFHTTRDEQMKRTKIGGLPASESGHAPDDALGGASGHVCCDTTLSRDYRFPEPEPDEFFDDDEDLDAPVATRYEPVLVIIRKKDKPA